MANNTNTNGNGNNKGRYDRATFVMEGNLTKPVELRVGNNGQPYGYLILAQERGTKDDGTANTVFPEISVSGYVAQAAATLAKGDAIRVEGTVSFIPGEDTGTVDSQGKKVYSPSKYIMNAGSIAKRVFAPKVQTQDASAPAQPTQQAWQAPEAPVAPAPAQVQPAQVGNAWGAPTAQQAQVPQANAWATPAAPQAPQVQPTQVGNAWGAPAAPQAPQAQPAQAPQANAWAAPAQSAAPAPAQAQAQPAQAGNAWQPQSAPNFAGNFANQALPFSA